MRIYHGIRLYAVDSRDVGTSWVIVSKTTGAAVLETFSKRVVDAVNLNCYRVVPIGEWLASLNKR